MKGRTLAQPQRHRDSSERGSIHSVVLHRMGGLNCRPMTVLDSRIERYLASNGHETARSPATADYVVFNTCTYTRDVERETRTELDRLISSKGESTRIVMVGCYVRGHVDTLRAYPDVIALESPDALDTLFLRTAPYMEIPAAAANDYLHENVRSPPADFHFVGLLAPYRDPIRKYSQRFAGLLDSALVVNRNLVEISRGCTEHCSFCAIRVGRGPLESVPLENILRTIESMEDRSAILSLVASDCGSYGREIGTDVFELLEAIHQLDRDLAIEITSLHPRWLAEHEAQWFRAFERYNIVEVGLPIQSGSNHVLSDMRRKYRIGATKDRIRRIRAANPSLFIRTHLIVGFPGESNRDLLRSLAAIPLFDHALVMPFVLNPSTPSFSLPNRVGPRALRARTMLMYTASYSVAFLRFLTRRDASG